MTEEDVSTLLALDAEIERAQSLMYAKIAERHEFLKPLLAAEYTPIQKQELALLLHSKGFSRGRINALAHCDPASTLQKAGARFSQPEYASHPLHEVAKSIPQPSAEPIIQRGPSAYDPKTPIDEVADAEGFSVRLSNSLRRNYDIAPSLPVLLEHVLAASDAQLLRAPNLGKKSLKELRDWMAITPPSGSMQT